MYSNKNKNNYVVIKNHFRTIYNPRFVVTQILYYFEAFYHGKTFKKNTKYFLYYI